MKTRLVVAVAAFGLMCATTVMAAPLKLTPANPQPSAGQLKKGLAVKYGYVLKGQDIKSLADATQALQSRSERGKPLKGLDYRDTNEGDKTLTSKEAFNVAAAINGYVRFDQPGTYDIEFLTNDGLRATVGGQRVGFFDGRQACESTTIVTVQAPVAGWYKLDALYFQRLGTSCLHMRMGPSGGSMKWMPDSAFAH